MDLSNLLAKVTDGCRPRDMLLENQRLAAKWEKWGLLDGLKDTAGNPKRSNMARLLQNQALHFVNEASTMASGDVKGFTTIAFPIVRRVWGGLFADQIVSTQPMSLPSGLVFYFDVNYGTSRLGGGFSTDNSVYGEPVGGPELQASGAAGSGGVYNLNSSFSQPDASSSIRITARSTASWSDVAYDPDLSGSVVLSEIYKYTCSALHMSSSDATSYKQWQVRSGSNNFTHFRRHNTLSSNVLTFYISGTAGSVPPDNAVNPLIGGGSTYSATNACHYVYGSTVTEANGVTLTPRMESDFTHDVIPELDLSVKSVAVTAEPRKLKVKWTPELAQDLQAYHGTDAEVLVTQTLSELIAVEIDREIIGDLLNSAKGANQFWSRQVGRYLIKDTGALADGSIPWYGSKQDWYQTLAESILDVGNQIHRKTLRGSANFVVTSPDVCTVLESTSTWRTVFDADPQNLMYSMGTEKAGTLNSKMTVYKDPYFPRNKILVGYKGNSWLDVGYVYAPYIPAILTPILYGVDQFEPRRGIMTRYGKKCIRSDFYGTIVCREMNII